MRSMSESAWRISSSDSSYERSASRWKPQFFCIREWPKYWLTAVSSAVNTSLSNSMIWGGACIALASCSGGPSARSSGRWLDGLHHHSGGEKCPDGRSAGTAAGTCAAHVADILDRAGPARDGVTDGAVVHDVAVADDH